MSARTRTLLLALAIVAATVLAYGPSLPGDFIWDDDSNVTQNEFLRDAEGLRDVWVPEHTPQYYPITFSAFWGNHGWRLSSGQMTSDSGSSAFHMLHSLTDSPPGVISRTVSVTWSKRPALWSSAA